MVVHSTFKTQHPKQSIKPQQFTKIGSGMHCDVLAKAKPDRISITIMSHTVSISGDDWGMKNCDTDAWVFCDLSCLQCCSPVACCLMSDSPPCATENTRRHILQLAL